MQCGLKGKLLEPSLAAPQIVVKTLWSLFDDEGVVRAASRPGLALSVCVGGHGNMVNV